MISNAIASVPVKNLKAATTWYERVLGRPATSTPMPEVAEWEFPKGGWLQVYEGPDRAGGGSFTLSVDDMDQTLMNLEAVGIDTSNRGVGASTRTVMVSDPDGNSIAFAHTDDPTMAR